MKQESWIAEFINETCLFFLQQDSRLYYPFLLSALLISILYFLFLKIFQQKKSLKLVSFLFPKDFLKSSSFKLDIQLFVINNFLRSLIVIPLGIMAIQGMWMTVKGLDHMFGYHSLDGWSSSSITLCYTIVFFVLSDLSRWILHYFFHHIPALWSFHRVHHSATFLNPLTVFRLHPLEFFAYKFRGILVFSIVGGTFYYMFRTQITPYTLFSIHIGLFIFNILGSNLRHSHIHISYPDWLENILISPAQHQLHHCILPEKSYKNFGSTLAIWDRMAGTIQYGRSLIPLKYGAKDTTSDQLTKNIVEPITSLFKRKS